MSATAPGAAAGRRGPEHTAQRGAVLAGDVGRTTCRLARYEHGVRVAEVQGPCGVSLSDRDGVAGIHRVVVATLAQLAPGAPVASVALGITGAAQRPEAAGALAAALQAELGAPVTVASDVTTAHAGALGGGPGVLTIAGTGAVALGVDAGGGAVLVDGWGPLLGDAGSAVDVGRAGLVAALRAHDGRGGGSAALAAAARERFGQLDGLPGLVQGDPSPFRLLASFAPAVAAAARGGDDVAAGIFARAVEHLVATTLAAARHVGASADGDRGAGADAADAADAVAAATPVDVTLAGGLAALDDLVAGPVGAALRARGGVAPRASLGDALDGAHALAIGTAGVHHRLTWCRRAGAARTPGHGGPLQGGSPGPTPHSAPVPPAHAAPTARQET